MTEYEALDKAMEVLDDKMSLLFSLAKLEANAARAKEKMDEFWRCREAISVLVELQKKLEVVI